MFSNSSVNETFFNDVADGAVAFNDTINGSGFIINLTDVWDSECNPIVDRIGGTNGLVVCYHQYTVQEIIDKLVPAFVIFAIVMVYVSYRFALPRLRESERLRAYIKKRRQTEEE